MTRGEPTYHAVCEALMWADDVLGWQPTEAHLALHAFASLHHDLSGMFTPDDLFASYRNFHLIDPYSGARVKVLPDHLVHPEDVLLLDADGRQECVVGALYERKSSPKRS